MKKFLLLCCLVTALFSCQEDHKVAHATKAFYYWKNNEWNFEPEEQRAIESLGAKKLYIKFFEVEHNEFMGDYPTAKTNLNLHTYDSLTVVPSVYLRNEVFLKTTKGRLDTLADNVNFLILKYSGELKDQITEYQMDCDWTPKSRDNYFYFLKKLKGISAKKISCTLCLYPYKYPEKMGIPPVDRATLMCYNLINPLTDHTKNSILDLDELKAYVKGVKEYDLPLDVALPIYSWMQVYQNNQFSTVTYDDCKTLKNSVMKPDKPLWYVVTKDTTVNNIYLRIGDRIKYEEITAEKVNNAIDILKQNVPFGDSITVTLFHLDQNQLSNYSNEDLSGFYSRFTK